MRKLAAGAARVSSSLAGADHLRECRLAARQLARNPLFSLGCVATVSIAVGSTTAVLALVVAVWLRPAPVRDPDRLALRIWQSRDRSITSDRVTWEEFQRLGPSTKYVEGLAVEHNQPIEGLRPRAVLASGRSVVCTGVSDQYFQVLGVRVRGRPFTPGDGEPRFPIPLVISNDLWRTEFDAQSDAVGQTIRLSGLPARVIGVAPPGFGGPRRGDRAGIWIPLPPVAGLVPDVPAREQMRYSLPVRVYARLRPDVATSQAGPELAARLPGRGRAWRLRTLAESAYPLELQGVEYRDRRLLAVLSLMAGIVLLSGWINLITFTLARRDDRKWEAAVRAGLGATPMAEARRALLDATLLAIAGAGGVLLCSRVIVAAVSMLDLPTGLTVASLQIQVDRYVAGCGVLLAWLSLAGAGLAGITRMGDLSTHLRTARDSARSLPRARFLLADLGFSPKSVFVTVVPGLARYVDSPTSGADMNRYLADYEFLLARLRATPGVEAVAEGACPLQDPGGEAGSAATSRVLTDGREHHLRLSTLMVGPGYFSTLKIARIAGREFAASDRAPAPGGPHVGVAY
jgi:hypothetical protein